MYKYVSRIQRQDPERTEVKRTSRLHVPFRQPLLFDAKTWPLNCALEVRWLRLRLGMTKQLHVIS